MAGQTVTVSVLADTKRFTSGMKKVANDTGLSKLAGAAKKAAIGVGIGIGAVVAGAVVLGKQALDSLKRIQRIGAQTSAVLKSTGGAAGRTKKQIDSLAGSIEKMSGVEAESVTEGQNLLLTYTNIKGVNFDRTTQAMTDMAVALNKGKIEGLDMSSAANTLGKALNDPEKGLSKLSRVGVQFTDQQKKQIIAMAKAGDAAGAQALMLEELERQFGGSAEAAGTTVEGMQARVGNMLGDITEKLFAFLLPAFAELSEWLLNVGVPALSQFVNVIQDRVTPNVKRLGEWFKAEGVPRLKEFAAWVKAEVVPRVTEFARVVNVEVLPRLQALAGWLVGSLIPALITFGAWVVRNRVWLIALAAPILAIVGAWKLYQTGLAVAKAVQLTYNTTLAAGRAIQTAYVMGTYGQIAGNSTLATTVAAVTGAIRTKVLAMGGAIASGVRWLAGMVAQTAAMVATRAAVLVATAAQWAYNAALTANPIGLIVAAIAALIAGLVFFFTKTELGRKLWAKFTSALSDGWRVISGAFAAGYRAVVDWLGKVGAFIKRAWSYSPLGLIITNWDKIIGFFRGLPGKLKTALASIATTVTAPFKTAFNAIARLWNNSVGKIAFDVPSWVPGIGGKSWGLPKIPMLASGGILTRPTMFLGGEGGEPEAVLPLSKLEAMLGNGGRRGGDVKIEINVTAGIGDPVEIGRQITAALTAYGRVNGARA